MIRISIFTLLIFGLFICLPLHPQQNDSIQSHGLSAIEILATTKPSTSISTAPLQVLTNDELLRQGIQSASDAVRRFNGIVLKDYGGIGGLKTIAIRGMGAEHTAVSYDGVMVSNVQSGQVDIGRFALDNVSLISFSIGQSDDIFQTAKAFAAAGMLNLQTITPTFDRHNYKGHASLTTGSFGLFNPMVNYAQKLNNTFTASANINWQRADGKYPFIQEDDKILTERKRKNSDVDIFRSEVNLYSDFGIGGRLNTKIYYYDSERGLPGNVTLGNDYAKERLWDKNLFIQTAYHKTFGNKFRFKSQAKYDYNNTRYEDNHAKYENRKLVNKYREQEFYLSNSLLYLMNDYISFSFSEDLFYNKLKNEMQQFGTNLPYPERYNSLSALAFQYKNKRLTITSNILATYIEEKVKNNKGNTTYKKLSPSAGISYRPFDATNLRFRAFYKHLYRIPTFTELYYTSVDKTLNPESAKQLNGGITWVGNIKNSPINFLSFSADGYYNKVDDKIVIIPRTFIATTMNLGNVDIKGLDLKLVANCRTTSKTDLTLTMTYSYIQAEDVTDESNETYKNQLQYTPKHSGAATISFNTPWVSFSYSVIAASERYSMLINDKSNRIDSYTDHSISLFQEFDWKDNKLYLQGNILNLWDKGYEIIAYYPMPGRSFKLSAGIRF